MAFAQRKDQHDSLALPAVGKYFEQFGYSVHSFGIELSPDMHEKLKCLHNGTSKMLRYRPDLIAIHPEKGSLLLEVKSVNSNSSNFAVELDAWEAARIWCRSGATVLYVFVDIPKNILLCCFPDKLEPQKIFVPRKEDLPRIMKAYKTATIIYKSNVNGSGTAFFLVPKNTLESLETVLTNWQKP